MEANLDFASFIEQHILPIKSEKQNKGRIDGGQNSYGRSAFGYFYYDNKRWRVNSDSYFEPLLLAYDHYKKTGLYPFREGVTPSDTPRLFLLPELSEKSTYFYVYG